MDDMECPSLDVLAGQYAALRNRHTCPFATLPQYSPAPFSLPLPSSSPPPSPSPLPLQLSVLSQPSSQSAVSPATCSPFCTPASGSGSRTRFDTALSSHSPWLSPGSSTHYPWSAYSRPSRPHGPATTSLDSFCSSRLQTASQLPRPLSPEDQRLLQPPTSLRAQQPEQLLQQIQQISQFSQPEQESDNKVSGSHCQIRDSPDLPRLPSLSTPSSADEFRTSLLSPGQLRPYSTATSTSFSTVSMPSQPTPNRFSLPLPISTSQHSFSAPSQPSLFGGTRQPYRLSSVSTSRQPSSPLPLSSAVPLAQPSKVANDLPKPHFPRPAIGSAVGETTGSSHSRPLSIPRAPSGSSTSSSSSSSVSSALRSHHNLTFGFPTRTNRSDETLLDSESRSTAIPIPSPFDRRRPFTSRLRLPNIRSTSNLEGRDKDRDRDRDRDRDLSFESEDGEDDEMESALVSHLISVAPLRHGDPLNPDENTLRAAQVFRGTSSTKMVASALAIGSLQIVDINELLEHDRTCVICYNDFGVVNPEGFIEAPLRLPVCQHVFGDHCIKKWFEDSDSCPYCRLKVPSEPRMQPGARAVLNLVRMRTGQHNTPLGGLNEDIYLRILSQADEALLNSASHRSWIPERRPPPSETPDGRRRLRPRHGGRISGSPPSVARSGSFSLLSASAQHQQPTREPRFGTASYISPGSPQRRSPMPRTLSSSGSYLRGFSRASSHHHPPNEPGVTPPARSSANTTPSTPSATFASSRIFGGRRDQSNASLGNRLLSRNIQTSYLISGDEAVRATATGNIDSSFSQEDGRSGLGAESLAAQASAEPMTSSAEVRRW